MREESPVAEAPVVHEARPAREERPAREARAPRDERSGRQERSGRGKRQPRPEAGESRSKPQPIRHDGSHMEAARPAERRSDEDDDAPVLAFGDHMPAFLRHPVKRPASRSEERDEERDVA